MRRQVRRLPAFFQEGDSAMTAVPANSGVPDARSAFRIGCALSESRKPRCHEGETC